MRLIVVGPNGKMGRLITKFALENPILELVGAVGSKGSSYIGDDVGVVITDDLEDIIETCNVIIDFSTKENAKEVVRLARKYNKALVCGTTGFSEEEFLMFREAGEEIPMLYAANTSRLVNIMNKLLGIAGSLIGESCDIELIEMHDKWKKDVPSGTSKEMGKILAEAMGEDWNEIARFGRAKGANEREEKTLGYHSIRAGNISSSHTVLFGGMGERLEITHHAYDWECFARGACECALFLQEKPAGFYTITDVIGNP